MKISSYRGSIVIYLFIFLLISSPYWGLEEVVAPYRQFTELALTDNTGDLHLENRKFSDFNNGFIPRITEHLVGNRSGWLTLWTDANELGRPMYQASEFSPAYLLSWAVALLTDNPWVAITITSLLVILGSGGFVILFCRELGLNPLAGLIAGVSMAFSPLFMYWLTFPIFLAVWCWSAGSLWAVTRLFRRPDLLGWGALAFSLYSLLMTAYPQAIVFHAYLLMGYGLYLLYRKSQLGSREIVRFLALSGSALVVGAGLAAPIYRDLIISSVESARVAPDPSFFTAVLPKFANFYEVVRFFVLGTIPELFGNPISPAFPFVYDGLSVTLLVIFFAVVGLLTAFKQTWGWWLAICALCLLAFVPSLYVLGVKYLGFNLSRSNPLASIMLPLIVIVAYGVDAMVKRTEPGRVAKVTVVASVCVLFVIAVGLAYSYKQSVPPRWGMALIMLGILVLLAVQYRKTQPVLLVISLFTVLVSVSYPLMLRQDLAHIAITSPLVEKMRESLPEGSRFAVAAPGISVLPPNMNASFGLASVHSYNSLSSTRYHTLIEALGGEMQTYGRWNEAISPDYASAMFWMSNIGLMLSSTKLANKNLEYLGSEAGVHLYKVNSRMGRSVQVITSPHENLDEDSLYITDPRLLQIHSPLKILDEGDILEFEVKPEISSTLILSQKFHRDWQARALVQQKWLPVKTQEINGVFQGVAIPPNAQRIRLEFKPFARYAWGAHVFWLILIVLLGITAWQKARNMGKEGA